jgi:hypothetical protein
MSGLWSTQTPRRVPSGPDKLGLVKVHAGDEWLLKVIFDVGKNGSSRDLRPDLPLRLRY